MRKLYILKAVVDFVWIMTWLTLPFFIILFFVLLFSNEPFDVPISINGSTKLLTSGYENYLLLAGITQIGILLYALYFFRKLLTNFRRRKIFEQENASLLKKMGNLVIISALVYFLFDLGINLLSDKLTISIGYGPFVYLLGFGLFLYVLSEVFQMGNQIKEENELTI